MKNVKDKPAILAPYLNGYTTATKLVFDNIIDDLNLKQDDKAYISSEIDKILKKKQEIMRYYEEHLGDMNSQIEIYKLNKIEIDKKFDEMVGIEKDLIEFVRGVEHTLNRVRTNATYGLWGYKK